MQVKKTQQLHKISVSNSGIYICGLEKSDELSEVTNYANM